MLDRMALSLKQNLKAKGIKVLSVETEGEQTDPILWITGNIHIQVGFDYVHVVREENGLFTFFTTNGNVNDIMVKLKEAIK